MKPTHIEHIGIAVSNLENAISLYENTFGLRCYKIEEVAIRNEKNIFFCYFIQETYKYSFEVASLSKV